MSYRRIARVSANTWILVADRSQAVIYQATWPYLERYEEVDRIVQSEDLTLRENLLAKRSGRFSAHGVTHQSGEPRINFRRKTAQGISQEILQRLEQGRTRNEFGRLIIVAPALLLGVIREQISAPLAKTVVMEIRKELVDAPARLIMQHVDAALAEQEELVEAS